MTNADNSRFRPYDRNEEPEPTRSRVDPLSELARLIGQNDPFAQRIRDAQPEPPRDDQHDSQPEPAWHPDPAPVDPRYEPQPPAAQQSLYSHEAEFHDDRRDDHQVEYRDDHRVDHTDEHQFEHRDDRTADRHADRHADRQDEYPDEPRAAAADPYDRAVPPYQPAAPRFEPTPPRFEPSAPPPRYEPVAPRFESAPPVRYEPVTPRFQREHPRDAAALAPSYRIPGFPRDDELLPPPSDILAIQPSEPDAEPPQLDDEIPLPPERRNRWLAPALVFVGLAAVGSGAAFAYRGYFGDNMKFTLPPVIRASTEPTKVAPPPVKSETTANKITYDRFGDRTQNEKVVAREEKPVDPKNFVTAPPAAVAPPAATPFPPKQPDTSFPAVQLPAAAPTQPPAVRPPATTPPAAATAQAANPPSVLTEPKRVRTVVVKPDGPNTVPAMQPASTPAARSRVATNTANAPLNVTPSAAPRAQTRAAVPPQTPGANAPLALTPGTTSTGPAASRPVRTATPTRVASTPAAPATTASTHGRYLVQVSSQRSEKDAQSAYRGIKAKYASVLGSHEPVIRRADLGAKGVYYRAMVGPFSTREQAIQLCASLKAAGGACVVQTN